MKKIVNLITISCLILGIVALFGCKSKKKDVVEETPAVTYSEDEYLAVQEKLKQKDNELAIYDDRYKSLDAFKKKSVINAGSWTFNKIDDKIVLNGVVIGPTINASIKSTGLESYIMLGDKVKIDTNGWTIQSGTSEINLNIVNKSCGKIKIMKYVDEDFNYNNIVNDWLKPFLNDNGLEIQSTKEIYQNEQKIGDEATANIDILDSTTNGFEIKLPATDIFEEEELSNWQLNKDSEVTASIKMEEDKKTTAELRIGLSNSNGLLIYYEFINYDNSGKKLTDNLINSIEVNGSNIYLK